MPVTFEESIELPVPPERAFEALRDHPRWHEWMPASFRPVGASAGPLEPGMKVKVAVAGVPFDSTITMRVVEAPRELRWVGGVPGVVFADHAFFFEAKGAGCQVRSVETWTGALVPAVGWRASKLIPPVLRAQLE